MESGRIVARLVRMVGDVGKAEDFAQDALVAALEKWSESGVPSPPDPEKPEYRTAINVWRKLPVAITRILGPPLSRLLP